MKCTAVKKNKQPCQEKAVYGVLCSRHARQIAGTPSGFQSRRVRRIHLPNITDEELLHAIQCYKIDKGEHHLRTSSALSYRVDVIELLLMGEKTAHEIVTHLDSISNYSITSSKVGQLMRTMMNEGTVVRRQANTSGVWGSIYALKTSQHERDP